MAATFAPEHPLASRDRTIAQPPKHEPKPQNLDLRGAHAKAPTFESCSSLLQQWGSNVWPKLHPLAERQSCVAEIPHQLSHQYTRISDRRSCFSWASVNFHSNRTMSSMESMFFMRAHYYLCEEEDMVTFTPWSSRSMGIP